MTAVAERPAGFIAGIGDIHPGQTIWIYRQIFHGTAKSLRGNSAAIVSGFRPVR